LVMTFPDGMV